MGVLQTFLWFNDWYPCHWYSAWPCWSLYYFSCLPGTLCNNMPAQSLLGNSLLFLALSNNIFFVLFGASAVMNIQRLARLTPAGGRCGNGRGANLPVTRQWIIKKYFENIILRWKISGALKKRELGQFKSISQRGRVWVCAYVRKASEAALLKVLLWVTAKMKFRKIQSSWN